MVLRITERQTGKFAAWLREQERSEATVRKYLRALRLLAEYLSGAGPSPGKGPGKRCPPAVLRGKEQLIDYKRWLSEERHYTAASVNAQLSALNGWLVFAGAPAWRLRFLKVQRKNFYVTDRVLTREEYLRLVRAAVDLGDIRAAMLLQTLASLGIRVSELPWITVESLREGCAVIRMKGKTRTVLIPMSLVGSLSAYCRRMEIAQGPVFCTRNGRPLDRSNVWRVLKRLAIKTGVDPDKVYPHNFRHFFAISYYEEYKDIVRLADILGHASVDTTRIYTMHRGIEERQQMDRLGLVLTEEAYR